MTPLFGAALNDTEVVVNPSRTRLTILTVIACAFMLAFAGSASATFLTPTNQPLSPGGSTFQGGDGNESPEVVGGHQLTDWKDEVDANNVTLAQDSQIHDSCFGSPNQKQLNPGGWVYIDCGVGVNPSKDNLLAGWTSVDQPGDTFLNLAFTREAQSG